MIVKWCVITKMVADNTNSTIGYMWTCAVQDTAVAELCKFANGSTVGTYSSSEIEFEAGTFSSGTSMTWTLTLTKDITRTASASARVTISPAAGPVLTLSAPDGPVQKNDIITISAALQNGQALSSYYFTWTVDSCLDSGCIYGNIGNDFVRVAVGRVNFTTYSNKFKVTLLLTSKATGATAQGSVWVEVDSLPTPGIVTISPTDGYAWSTNYTVLATDFTVASGKLLYKVFYMMAGTSELVPVSLKTEGSSHTTQFPAGSAWYDYSMTVVVRVYNERGGYIQVNKTFACKELSGSTSSTVVTQYQTLKSAADQNNPQDLLARTLLGSLLFTSPNVSSTTLCSGQGVLTNGHCICNLDFSQRSDCSISDSQFALETQLAGTLLNDTKALLALEPSSSKQAAGFEVVLKITGKPDLLSASTRALARDILANCTANDSAAWTYSELARAIDGVAVLTNKSEEFAQIRTLIGRLIEKQVANVNLTYGNEVVDSDVENFRVRSVLTRGSLNATINMSNIVFPTTLAMLNDTDEYVRISVVEWDTAVYAWSGDYPRTRTNAISIEARSLQGVTKKIDNLLSPISITFPLETASISAQDLTALRCMYYVEASDQYSISGMKFIAIDLDRELGKCEAYHMTDFVMGVPSGGIYILPSTEEETTVFGAKVKIYKLYMSPLFWFTVSVTLLCSYLCLWAYCKEKSENELVDLMRSKAYMEQKDFFQEKTKVELAPAELNDSGGRQHESGHNSSGSAGESSDPRRISSMAEGSSQMQDSTPVSALGSARDEVTKVEPFAEEDNKAGTFRREEEKKPENAAVVGVPEEVNNTAAASSTIEKKDTFDKVATPLPTAEIAAQPAKPRRFRRKRKLRRRKNADGEGKAQPDQENCQVTAAGLAQVSTVSPAPVAVDLAMTRTGAENIEEIGIKKQQGTISTLLVLANVDSLLIDRT